VFGTSLGAPELGFPRPIGATFSYPFRIDFRHNLIRMAREGYFRFRWTGVVIGLFFCLSGALAILLLLLGTPSFWYFPCAVLWTGFGITWTIRPSLAAGLSVFPVLGIAIMLLQALPNFWRADVLYRVLILCVLAALALIAATFRKPEARRLVPLLISLSLVLAAFLVDRAFTNKVAIHTYSMSWSTNGSAPWGSVERDERGQTPVVVYRSVGGGYCYDAIFSPELKGKLSDSNRPVVTVEYNVFSDFGRERGYNIRSVDGLVFNEGSRPVRSSDGYGGYIMNGPNSNCQR